MSMAFLPRLSPRTPEDRYTAIERKLIQREAKIGGKLFGPVPEGHQRQFFCLDERTLVWHESWIDQNGQQRSMTTRYDIRPNGIIKIQDGQHYQRLSRSEVQNVTKAAKLYQQRVIADYYRLLGRTA